MGLDTSVEAMGAKAVAVRAVVRAAAVREVARAGRA